VYIICIQADIEVSFAAWLSVSIPFGVVSTLIAWVLLIVILDPSDIKSIPIVVYKRDNKLSKRNIAVLGLAFLTMVAFSCFHLMKGVFGDIAMVSLLYVCIMFGTGMLTEVSTYEYIRVEYIRIYIHTVDRDRWMGKWVYMIR
jgi:di/tricarboxylate transporter